MTKHCLIISASIGGGHVSAALALEQAFAQHPETQDWRVEHLDLINFTYVGFRRLYRDAYFDLVNRVPDFVDWFGRQLEQNHTGRQQRLLSRLSRIASRRLARYIKNHQPDIIIHTHFLAPALLNKARYAHIPQYCVVTDYGAHRIWYHSHLQGYFVACPEVAVHLRSYDIPSEHIHTTGIPIKQSFKSVLGQDDARQRLNVSGQSLLFLASGIKATVVRDLLQQLRQLSLDLDIFIICGRSPELQNVVRRSLQGYRGRSRFHQIGYSQDLPLYMAAADLLIGKPGGLTSSEALATALPMAIVSPYPLQEEANANYLLENGVAMRIEPLSVFGFKLERFLNEAPRQQHMRQAALQLAKPQAADHIVDYLSQASHEGRDQSRS